MPTPSRIKPNQQVYEELKLMDSESLKDFIRSRSREVSQNLFKAEEIIISTRETRQLIAIAEKMLSEKTTEPAPTPAPVVEERVPDLPSYYQGGKRTETVFSSNDWYKLMESPSGSRDVALYHDRSESGLQRIRSRALAGDFPESKYKSTLYGLLLDGYTPAEVAKMFHREEEWVINSANYLSAVMRRKREGLSVPDLGVTLP